jgi:RHS repeat-associated protein
VATDSSGNVQYGGTHFPFGEGGVSDKWAFTSYERDESGLDYAIFRYYSPRIGRFMSADLLAGNVQDPQSLNRYAYVMNDPIRLTDPLGLCICIFYYPADPSPGQPREQLICIGCSGYGGGGGAGGRGGPAPFEDTGGGGGGGEAKLTKKNLVTISPHCLDVFSKLWPGFSERDFQDLLRATPILNARDPLTASLTVAEIVGATGDANLDRTMLGRDAPGRPAVVPAGRGGATITGAWGSAIVTGPTFYAAPGLNANLVHEGLHVYTGYNDQALFDALKPYGLEEIQGTASISDWIANDCRMTR